LFLQNTNNYNIAIDGIDTQQNTQNSCIASTPLSILLQKKKKEEEEEREKPNRSEGKDPNI
jgi:hypothetical protein